MSSAEEIKDFKLNILDLSAEIVINIFSYLSADTLLSCVSLVCKLWYAYAQDGSLWKTLSTRSGPTNRAYTKQVQPLKLTDNEWKHIYFQLGQVSFKKGFPLIQEGVEASSTDHPNQSIDMTLEPEEETFWSSTGKADPASDEYLIFKLKQPICAIYSVGIIPYKAFFQQGQPIYAPRAIRISIGFSKSEFHWVSPTYPVVNVAELQTFKMMPELVFGGYIRLDLVGRYQTQSMDDLWYTVLQNVYCNGIPIGALSSQLLKSSAVNFALSEPAFFSTSGLKHEALDDEEQISTFITNFLGSMDKQAQPLLGEEQQRQKDIAAIYQFLEAQDFAKAIAVVYDAPKERNLRTEEIVSLFLKQPMEIIRQYFNAMLRKEGALTKFESFELVKILMKENPVRNLTFVASCMEREKFTPSQELADLIRQHNLPLAYLAYRDLGIPDKIVACLKEMGRYDQIIIFSMVYRYDVDFVQLLEELKAESLLKAVQFGVKLSEANGGSPVELDRICKVLDIEVPPGEWDLKKVLKNKLESLLQREEPTEEAEESVDQHDLIRPEDYE